MACEVLDSCSYVSAASAGLLLECFVLLHCTAVNFYLENNFRFPALAAIAAERYDDGDSRNVPRKQKTNALLARKMKNIPTDRNPVVSVCPLRNTDGSTLEGNSCSSLHQRRGS